jgi:uncharacterized protein (DUF1800 family)
VSIDRDLGGAVAVTRFGLGARPGEIANARSDPRGFLLDQISLRGADLPVPDGPNSTQRLADLAAYQRDRKAALAAGDAKADPVKMAAKLIRDDAGADFLARVQLGVKTDNGFRERWALFWANHFTVSANKLATATLVGPFEQEAIRPYAFGRFEDMLVASSSHPAMLLYLDQAQSVGPNSDLAVLGAKAGKHPGLNENLAREIMELHTVGVDAGYSQADVTEFARAMTGWSLGRTDHPEDPQGFLFRPHAHEPGGRTIMGKPYGEQGQLQARAVMTDLAASPHTAKHLSTKIARHFVSDDPPPALVDRLARSYLASGGRLDEVAATLIRSPEAWAPAAAKFKTPYEFMISSWRAADTPPTDVQQVARTMDAMGQKPFSAPSPKGWPEEAPAWCAPDAVIKRMTWSEGFAQGLGDRDPMQLADNALGARLTPLAAKTIARAETRPEAVAILLMSPEFQRR